MATENQTHTFQFLVYTYILTDLGTEALSSISVRHGGCVSHCDDSEFWMQSNILISCMGVFLSWLEHSLNIHLSFKMKRQFPGSCVNWTQISLSPQWASLVQPVEWSNTKSTVQSKILLRAWPGNVPFKESNCLPHPHTVSMSVSNAQWGVNTECSQGIQISKTKILLHLTSQLIKTFLCVQNSE